MNLPFTPEQFLNIFEYYNLSIWPFQIVLNLLAILIIFLCFKIFKYNNKIISGLLAFFWIWIGIVYHWIYFTSINKAAYVFGLFFIVQGMIFIFTGIFREKLIFRFQINIYSAIGIIIIFYALIIYPLLGHFLGHIYPKSPTFGLPCPTTIFTFGILLFTENKFPKYVMIIPLIWSIIGFTAAVNLYIYEDFGLLIAGLLGITLLFIRDRKLPFTDQTPDNAI